jgi:Tfp pilus assembly protein PilV
MSLHHMHQVGQRAANKFQMQSHPSFKPFCNHNFSSRRQLTVVAGEARSANRTKWTRQDAEQQLAGQADVTEIQTSNGAIQQLADIDPHELVIVVLPTAAATAAACAAAV